MNKIQLNLIFGLSALATVAHRQCYELDGSLSVNWTSCGDDASYCCRSDYSKCYTEGVCKDVSNSPDPLQYLFWTSRCATSTWTVDCPIYCPSEGLCYTNITDTLDVDKDANRAGREPKRLSVGVERRTDRVLLL